MHEEFKNATGNTCIFTDDGIWIIPQKAEKDTAKLSDTFYPYGSIKQIKLGGILGCLNVRGLQGTKERFFVFATDKEDRPRLKELIIFAQEKMKTAPRADVVDRDYGHPYYEAELFYEKCCKAELTLTKKANKATIARAKLIAEENHLPIQEDKIIETYLLGQSEVRRLATEAAYKCIFKEAKALETMLSHHGREKEIFVAQKNFDYYKALHENIVFGKSLPLQKEQDWALMGGIAAGIAGGAAGLAVASDIQMKNAAIRERNDQLRSAYAKAIIPTLTEVNRELNQWQNRLEKAKHALVDDSSPEKLFENVKISKERVYVLSDGSFVVQARAVVHHVKIYDTEDAIIDGSITAIVYQNGEKVGEAPIVIPQYGDKTYINRIECDLIGASSSNGAIPNLPCEVEFRCRDLWAVESKCRGWWAIEK